MVMICFYPPQSNYFHLYVCVCAYSLMSMYESDSVDPLSDLAVTWNAWLLWEQPLHRLESSSPLPFYLWVPSNQPFWLALAVLCKAFCSVIRAVCPFLIGPRYGTSRKQSPIACLNSRREASSKQHCLQKYAVPTWGGDGKEGKKEKDERNEEKRDEGWRGMPLTVWCESCWEDWRMR